MLRLLFQKLLHKKWMVSCLLLGNILLIAVAAGYPMYKNASITRMLNNEFENYNIENYKDVGLLSMVATYSKGERKSAFLEYREYANNILHDIGVDSDLSADLFVLSSSGAKLEMKRNDAKAKISLSLSALSELEQNVTLLKGRMYAEEASDDGIIEAVISKNCYIKNNFVLDDVITFYSVKNPSGDPITVKIVGVFDKNEEDNKYWANSPSYYTKNIFIPYTTFQETFLEENFGRYGFTSSYFRFADYNNIEVSQVRSIIKNTKNELKNSSMLQRIYEPGYLSVLEEVLMKYKKIEVTLPVLQIPVLVLLSIFLVMISKQMLSMEQNEISVLKSRGASKRQIVGLYLLQSIILTFVSAILGMMLGFMMCKAIGSANEFMTFVKQESLQIVINLETMLYILGAILFSILLTVLPVIKYSGVSIVHLKRAKSRKAKPLWRKVYFDFILIGISLYGYFNFERNRKNIIEEVLAGEKIDPLLYICSSLFLLGTALLFVRIQPLILKLIYTLGKKRYSPSNYVSFLQSIRTGSKQQFIIIFLVLTISLGIYNSTVARTILANEDGNQEYLVGTDIVFQEVWRDNSADLEDDPELEFQYIEPDDTKLMELTSADTVTKVLKDTKAGFTHNKEEYVATLMGVNTKEFGEVIHFPDGLLPYHINDYLNVLSLNSSSVLVSSNFKTLLEYRLNDSITYYDHRGNKNKARICGFVDYWPEYDSISYIEDAEGNIITKQNYLIIGHLTEIQTKCMMTPYEIWIKTKDGNTDFFYEWAEKHNLQLSSMLDLTHIHKETREDTLFQGTNGVLTMCFIIILILCCVGYLIYWILSIKERELLFGVFRAMGMSRKEILHMLINEQVFTGLSSILYGTVIGQLGAILFVPMMQVTYAAASQVLPLQFVQQATDMTKLYVTIMVVLLICIFILTRIISKMKITNALKLGED